MSENISLPGFDELSLSKPVLKALDDVGYEVPSPIQALTIPIIMQGKDVVGQAQTGTGKTAAFALPLLSRIDLKKLKPQVMVLTPTRELAIQVAEAFQKYAAHLKGFHVAPIYGGQDYRGQLRQLKRGVHVVVGTPGRVMDHIERKTLKLDSLDCLVLDEADEMLRMGFIDDVEWILAHTPEDRQVALFSATMPPVIRKIAKKHLNAPEEVSIKVRTTTADTIHQRYWRVSGLHKLDALTRILEAEDFDAMLVFVRTKAATLELTEKLQARGFNASAHNGDIPQSKRERTVNSLKNGKIDILVATDVAARGLDVDRISHVINYDIPSDTESYIHRVGRTGRAGRKGEAILFVAPRERRMLRAIEQATKQKIEMMELPSTEVINDKRIAGFKQRITDTLAQGEKELEFYANLLDQYRIEHNIPALEIAAALVKMSQGNEPMLLSNKPQKSYSSFDDSDSGSGKRGRGDRGRSRKGRSKKAMQGYRIEVGNAHGVMPKNIVGAIANEAGLASEYIGQIDINENFSIVDLPKDMPNDLLQVLKKTRVSGQELRISQYNGSRKTEAAKGRWNTKSKSKMKSKRGSKKSKRPNKSSGL